MLVKEMIEKLSKYPDDTKICTKFDEVSKNVLGEIYFHHIDTPEEIKVQKERDEEFRQKQFRRSNGLDREDTFANRW